MGLTVREMLKAKSFGNYELIAGNRGLDKQIQGVAIQDAPDGVEWTKGREFVITSGYIFKGHANLIYEYLDNEKLKKISCMGIKTRYIKRFPQDVLDKFDKLEIPLILIPEGISWMDVINSLNVLVMNKNIKQFNIGSINPRNISNLSYQGRKINQILSKMEIELNFPSMLYDVENDRSYYSSSSFVKLAEHAKEEDFWKPSFDHTREILCDNINMIRYRFIDETRFHRPFSWITIPIKVENSIKAYFVLVEDTELIDYFDQFSIRIGYLLLQSLYERVVAVREIEDRGFEKFLLDIINGYLINDEDIKRRALELDIDDSDRYFVLLMRQDNNNIAISEKKSDVRKALGSFFERVGFRSAIIDKDSLLFLIPADTIMEEKSIPDTLDGEIIKFSDRLKSKIPGSSYVFGISDFTENILNVKRNYLRCKQAIEIGKILYPDKSTIMYSQLGPFAWMNIQEDELKVFKKNIDALLIKDGNDDLIHTLKNYLQSNMNYSQTAKNMFVHINTVRNRIDHISDIMDIDLSDPINRLNLEILLRLIY